MSEELLKPKEMAAILRTTTRNLRRWVRAGEVPAVKFGSKTLFHLPTVLAHGAKKINGTGADRQDLDSMHADETR